jgi:hypothetical protein
MTVRKSVKASMTGLERVKQAAQRKGWTKTVTPAWWETANASQGTLKRFWRRIPIETETFQAICQAVGVDWEDVIEAEGSEMTTASASTAGLYEDDAWVGRQPLTEQLIAQLKGSTRILAIAGITGIGKSALAAHLALNLQATFPEIIKLNFDCQDKSDFVSVAVRLFSHWSITLDPEATQKSEQFLSHLVNQIRSQNCLVIIDSLENLLHGDETTGWSNFRDPNWLKFFQQLLSAEDCLSRIILTSQDLPSELAEFGNRYPNFWHCQPLQGLDAEEQLELFEKSGLTFAANTLEHTYLKRIGAAYEGHPLALRVIIGEIINSTFAGNVRTYWNMYGQEIEEIEKVQKHPEIESAEDSLKLDRYTRNLRRFVKQRLDKTFQRLQAEVNHAYLLLCLGAVYRRGVPESFWRKTLQALGLSEDQQVAALDALCDRYLLEQELSQNYVLLRQHNLVRSVALSHLKMMQPQDQS